MTITTEQDLKITEALKTAKGLSWDGCHKIYILMDAASLKQQKSYGYGDGSDSSTLITNFGPAYGLTLVHQWWEESCFLRFISTVTDEETYGSIIDQFENNEAEDLEDVDTAAWML
jgi:hypothetical protein